MAALTKHKASSVLAQLRHNNREDPPGKEPKNIEIDPSRTHLNYSLSPTDRVRAPQKSDLSRTEKAYYSARMKELYHMRRSDLVTAAEWCITMPKDLSCTSTEVQRKFFEETYQFCCKKYGEENIIQAVVHRDEGVKNKAGEVIAGQPHMHVVFIPVVPVTDTNLSHRQAHYSEKVNAKKLLNKHHLTTWHSEYQKWMDERFQKETGIRALVHTGVTAGKNVNVATLKAETKLHELQKEYEKQQEKIEAYEEQLQQPKQDQEWGHTSDWGNQANWGNSSNIQQEEKIW